MFKADLGDSELFYRQLFAQNNLAPNPIDQTLPDKEKKETSVDILIKVIRIEWAKLFIIQNNKTNNLETIKSKSEFFYTMLFLNIDNTMREQNLEYNASILDAIYQNCFRDIFKDNDDFFKRISRFFIKKLLIKSNKRITSH